MQQKIKDLEKRLETESDEIVRLEELILRSEMNKGNSPSKQEARINQVQE